MQFSLVGGTGEKPGIFELIKEHEHPRSCQFRMSAQGSEISDEPGGRW
jgi:hypothetical protein